jgi:nitrogen-specific signal transduction histidine kinase
LPGAKRCKTAELQIRLVRASEMNSHLKEMNLAAAGLAHETRNPLNIIRGLAQMISKRPTRPAIRGCVRWRSSPKPTASPGS